MSITVPIRELRNNTTAVIRAVEAGQDVTLTNRGRPIARISPIEQDRWSKRPYMTPDEVLAIPQADAGLREQLRALAEEESEWV